VIRATSSTSQPQWTAAASDSGRTEEACCMKFKQRAWAWLGWAFWNAADLISAAGGNGYTMMYIYIILDSRPIFLSIHSSKSSLNLNIPSLLTYLTYTAALINSLQSTSFFVVRAASNAAGQHIRKEEESIQFNLRRDNYTFNPKWASTWAGASPSVPSTSAPAYTLTGMASIEGPGASRSEDSAVSADVDHGIEIHGADYDSGGDRLAVPQTSIGTKCNDEKEEEEILRF